MMKRLINTTSSHKGGARQPRLNKLHNEDSVTVVGAAR
jgi:hypothetical protein